MSNSLRTTPAKRSAFTLPRLGWLGIALFVVGCLSAVWSATIREIDKERLGLLSMAVVFIPIGAMCMAGAYAACVRAELLQRVEDLENRLRGRSEELG